MSTPLAAADGQRRLLTTFSRHRVGWSIGLIVVVAVGYFGYRAVHHPVTPPRYVLAAVQRATIVASVTGTGQVSASSQVDLKPKASGDVTYVGVSEGAAVKAGALIVQLDARDALKAMRDAQVNLESAKLSLQKLSQPADALSVTQAQNSLARASESQQTATDDLQKAYGDAFNTIANAFLDLPTVTAGLQDLLFTGSSQLGGANQWNIDYYADAAAKYDDRAVLLRADANTKYQLARQQYDATFDAYQAANRSSDNTTITALLNQSYQTTRSLAEAIKSANNLIQFYKDTFSR